MRYNNIPIETMAKMPPSIMRFIVSWRRNRLNMRNTPIGRKGVWGLNYQYTGHRTCITISYMDLQYPVGKFQWSGQQLTGAERNALIEQIEATPAKIRAAAAGLSEAQLDTPYRPGGWTARQVIHHVADSHMNAFI